MKIFVTGNAGTGKSTVSKVLENKLRIKRFNLDPIVWNSGWKKTPLHIRNKKIEDIVLKDSWIIDGVSSRALEEADRIIFLDYPRRVCFWRAGTRSLRYLFKTRPELPKRSPEILIIRRLVLIIWRFPERVVPNILAQKDKRPSVEFIHISNNSDLQEYLHALG